MHEGMKFQLCHEAFVNTQGKEEQNQMTRILIMAAALKAIDGL